MKGYKRDDGSIWGVTQNSFYMCIKPGSKHATGDFEYFSKLLGTPIEYTIRAEEREPQAGDIYKDESGNQWTLVSNYQGDCWMFLEHKTFTLTYSRGKTPQELIEGVGVFKFYRAKEDR